MSIRILAIETTVDEGSVAASDGDQLIVEYPLDHDTRSARSLAPTMKQLLDSIAWEPSSIDLVAIDVGPGSFTGTRVGVTTAKVFAYAVGAECLAIDSLEIVAAQAPSDAALVSVAINAQRRQVFTADFARKDGKQPQVAGEGKIEILGNDLWLERLKPGTTVTGLALDKLSERLPSHVILAPQPSWTPRAATIAQLAAKHYAAGQRDDLWKLKPMYLRKSAAEEVWLERNESMRQELPPSESN